MIEWLDDVRMVEHPHAPLLAVVPHQRLYDEAVKVMCSASLDLTNSDDLDIVRNVSLGNLFFFLKYVAGYSGPYADLKDDLHMEMCNWRQEAIAPGSRYAGFVPRSSYKSSCWTHGAIAWELLRNPDLRIGIFSCILDRSLEFMHNVQRVFDGNDLMKVLFPEHVVTGLGARDARWNDSVAVMPNRTRNFTEPSLKAHTAGGSTQGIHVDLAAFDDIVGESQLNSEHQASSDMFRIRNWFFTAIPTLLVKPKTSRVTLAATRYSVDDPYERVMTDAYAHRGDWSGVEAHYPLAKDGKWNVYYRSAITPDGDSIFPEAYDLKSLTIMAKEDPWTYITQYVNNPHADAKLEFSSYTVRKAWLEFIVEQGEWMIHFTESGKQEISHVPLSACDVIVGADPAASDKRADSGTSRSAVVAAARDSDDNVFIFELRAGYIKPSMFFDWLFAVKRKFADVVRQVRVEAAGPFKFLGDLLRKEEHLRGEYLSLQTIPSMGEKLSTIRNVYEPLLKRGKLYVCDHCRKEFMAEFDVFPSSAMDILDAGKIAISATRKPMDDDLAEYDEDTERDDISLTGWSKRLSASTGY